MYSAAVQTHYALSYSQCAYCTVLQSDTLIIAFFSQMQTSIQSEVLR